MESGEESFTLSSFDFNSNCVVYSSDDEQQHDRRNKDDVDAYIELELPPAALAAPPPLPPLLSQVAASDDDDGDDDLDLRISFSAVTPFPGFSPSSTTTANIVSFKPLFSTCEDAKAQLTLTVATGSTPLPAVESTLACVYQRPLSNHSTISISSTKFPPPVDDNCHRSATDINGWELFRRRKPSPAANGRITKLLLKLRSIVISGLGSIRVSLTLAGNQTVKKKCPNSQRLTSMKPFERWLTSCKPSEPQQQMTTVRTNGGGSREMRSPSKVKEMKFEAMRKLLFGSAVSPVKSYNGISKCGKLNKSCPTSIKSSPIHQSGDASLVHAAIAHCKKSFGQNDDFSF